MNCKHEFVGRSDGVKCRLCGLFLTAEQILRAELAKQENSPVITASKSKSGAKKATKKA